MRTALCISAATAALLLSAKLFGAEQLPHAGEAAKKIGQDVEFEDVIKAVSYSRSRDGYYFSFGAPYPNQALSVWVPAAIKNRLPGSGHFVGRTVRIKGRVEASGTGPMVDLNAPEQYQLLPVDRAAVSKLILDGKQDRDEFKSAEAQYFWNEDFQTLETLAEELRQSQERFSDGTWLVDAFFGGLGLPPGASDARYAEAERKIALWQANFPASLVALLVDAQHHVDLAWKSRGTGYAKEISGQGREGFRRELANARQILETHPAAKMYPQYFVIMQSIALGQAWPKEAYFQLFSEATATEPDYYRFYFEAAHYLLPRWHGKKGEWEKFAEEQRMRRGPGGAGDALYARIAWSLKDYYGNLFRETAISWDIMASGFEYLIKENPQSRYLKNAYANFAWRAGDRVRLRKAFDQIKGDPDMNIWVNLENVRMAEDFLDSNR
jgi:hypothetical protein